MASPLSKDLIAGAIGESGSILAALPAVPLTTAEQEGVKFAAVVNAADLAAMRAMDAQQILDAAGKRGGTALLHPAVDGYFFPESPLAIFAGRQAGPCTVDGRMEFRGNGSAFRAWARRGHAGEFAKGDRSSFIQTTLTKSRRSTTASNNEEALALATTAGQCPFHRLQYLGSGSSSPLRRVDNPFMSTIFRGPRPAMRPEMGNVTAGLAGGVVRGGQTAAAPPPVPRGAVHSAEIEYALGNLEGNKTYGWTADDQKVSRVMEQYFVNFIKTGNPNGTGLPKWPAENSGKTPQFMHIDVGHAGRNGAAPRPLRSARPSCGGSRDGFGAGSAPQPHPEKLFICLT